MSGKWVVGLVGVFVVLGVAGVGFAAFTDPLTINGSATAGTLDVHIVDYSNNVAYPGHTYLTHLSGDKKSIDLYAWNLVPGQYPNEQVKLKNVGTLPAHIAVTLVNSDGNLVAMGGADAFDVQTTSGLTAVGGVWSVTHWVTLYPGHSIWDTIYVGIPAGSTSAPASTTFTIVYTATAGT